MHGDTHPEKGLVYSPTAGQAQASGSWKPDLLIPKPALFAVSYAAALKAVHCPR